MTSSRSSAGPDIESRVGTTESEQGVLIALAITDCVTAREELAAAGLELIGGVLVGFRYHLGMRQMGLVLLPGPGRERPRPPAGPASGVTLIQVARAFNEPLRRGFSGRGDAVSQPVGSPATLR